MLVQFSFLAHLSLIGELIVLPLSSCVCVYVCCMSAFSNIFSSETTGLIEAKFHMEPPWEWGTKVCSNGLGHMTR